MSTTGATDAQVRVAYGVADHYASQLVWEDENAEASFIDDLTDDICSHLVPPGMVIASAADVAKVPTAEEIAVLRFLYDDDFDHEWDDDPDGYGKAHMAMRAYLERVTG